MDYTGRGRNGGAWERLGLAEEHAMAKPRARWEVRETKGKGRRFASKKDAVRHARRKARATGRDQVVLDTRDLSFLDR